MRTRKSWMGAVSRWFRGDSGAGSLPTRMFWVALGLRLAYMTLGRTYQMRVITDHFEFGWEMGRIARAMATGYGYSDPFNGHSGPTAWTPPLYPILLAGVFKVFGVYTKLSAWVILAINCVFSALTAPAIYEIAWRCFGRDRRGLKVALWSGWLWAIYPAAMQYAVRWVWDMALTAMLFAWMIVLALRLRGVGEAENDVKSQSVPGWIGFGVLWGLIALSNSSLLTFLPACGLWILWDIARQRGGFKLSVRRALLGAVCFMLVVSPWVARNWIVFHAFVPMRTNFGAELRESVNFANMGFPWMATLSLAEKDPQFIYYKQVGELAYSREKGRQAKKIIREHPGIFAAHAVKRLYFFWVSVPHPIDKSLAAEVIRQFNFAFLSLGGILGLALALRRKVPGAWLFFWAFAIIPLIYYFVTVQARFRHPLEPIITVLIVYLFQSADLPGRKELRATEVAAA